MLKAAQSGKYRGTVLAGEFGDGRQGLFEDLLTSSVFERISYLPDETIAELFDRITKSARAETGELGDFQDMLFWPQYELNGRRVEPDVVVEFGELVVGIEAKRPVPGVTQTEAQLLEQLEAIRIGLASVEDEPRDVVLVAVGGRPATLTEASKSVIQMSWRDLWEHLRLLGVEGAGVRVVEDIQTALELAEVRTKDRLFFRSLQGVDLGYPGYLARRWRTKSPPRRLTPLAPVHLTSSLSTWRDHNGK